MVIATLISRLDDDRFCSHADPATPSSQPLLNALDRYRADYAKSHSLRPKQVLKDDVLDRIVNASPSSAKKLLAIRGIGEVTVKRHGPAILQIVREYDSPGKETKNSSYSTPTHTRNQSPSRRRPPLHELSYRGRKIAVHFVKKKGGRFDGHW